MRHRFTIQCITSADQHNIINTTRLAIASQYIPDGVAMGISAELRYQYNLLQTTSPERLRCGFTH